MTFLATPTAEFWDGFLSGFMISGVLLAADLAAVGMAPTATAPEGQLFVFSNAFVRAQVLGSPVPEASTWAMMMLGFAGLGYAGWRRSASSEPALDSWLTRTLAAAASLPLQDSG